MPLQQQRAIANVIGRLDVLSKRTLQLVGDAVQGLGHGDFSLSAGIIQASRKMAIADSRSAVGT